MTLFLEEYKSEHHQQHIPKPYLTQHKHFSLTTSRVINTIILQHQSRLKHTIDFFYKTLYSLLTSDMADYFYRNIKVNIISNIFQSLMLHNTSMHILTTSRVIPQRHNIFLTCTLSITPQSSQFQRITHNIHSHLNRFESV
ncbi:hypothetical protein V8G54_016272 [Vigna mungo]|uniref:Uncharacterized protein n=1 Tax=Vigna mungo TaxID=3915 RepID=A0AAQ3NM25_VIGMU